MRYFTEPPEEYTTYYGQVYRCEHPLYRTATLYLENGKGLCVIQQRFNAKSRATTWGAIDPWLVDRIYIHEGFHGYFEEHSGEAVDGLYPTVQVRSVMWSLRMKPIPRERWETSFGRVEV